MTAAPPTLVALHGFSGTPQAWHPILTAAVPNASVCMPALPGHGPTPWCADGSFTTVLHAWADAILPAGPLLLAGYSLGARVALGLSAVLGARVRALFLVGVHPGLRDPSEREARLAWDAAQARSLETDGLPAFLDAWERLPLFASQQRLPTPVLALQRAQRSAHTVHGLAWSLRAMGLSAMPDLHDTLATCRDAAWLVTGAEDSKFTALADACTPLGVTRRTVPASGHNVLLEAPGPLASLLAQWHALHGTSP